MQRLLAILLLAACAPGGCTCGSEEAAKSKPAPATGEAPRATPMDQGGAEQRTAALQKMKLAPLTVAEVQPLIPELPGATPVGQPGVLTAGRQVKAVLCLRSPSPETAMTQLRGALGALGFADMRTRPHPRSDQMVTLHAEKQPYQLGATVQKATTPDCPGDQGKMKVVLSYFKRVTGEPPAP